MSEKPDVCDFCNSPETVCRYQCMDFPAESVAAGVLYNGTAVTTGPTNLILNSRSYWAACVACSRFVDAEDIDGLLNHTKKVLIDVSYRNGDPLWRKNVIRHLRLTYELFFKSRIRIAEDSPGGRSPDHSRSH